MTTLAELFKKLESASERVIAPESIAVVRLDGANFSRFTKQFEKPFSDVFESAMNSAARTVLEKVLPNALLCYVGSDEISIAVSRRAGEIPYGARYNKLLSLTASYATVGFLQELPRVKGTPAFDARIIEFERAELLLDYVTWRRLDVRKNAISMAVSHLYSHRSLLGVSTAKRGELLEGTAFEKIPEGTFNGRFVTKKNTLPASRELAQELCEQALERLVM